MFLFIRKQHRKRQRENGIYFIIAMLCMSAGMLIGYFNTSISPLSFGLQESANAFSVFKFSIVKNSVMLLITYLNAFSLIGFPLTATTLTINGYLITVSTANMFLAHETGKLVFLLYNLPHIALVIIADIVLSERAFRFSQELFLLVAKNSFRGNFMHSTLRLTGTLAVCLLIVFIAAFYEGYIL